MKNFAIQVIIAALAIIATAVAIIAAGDVSWAEIATANAANFSDSMSAVANAVEGKLFTAFLMLIAVLGTMCALAYTAFTVANVKGICLVEVMVGKPEAA